MGPVCRHCSQVPGPQATFRHPLQTPPSTRSHHDPGGFARNPFRGLLALALVLTCASAHAETPPFRTGILPILTKAGCNTGGCHGAATGQGGFRLSLLGYDPDEDYLRITRERSGRRIDLDQPAESLVLRKPARQLDHEGGRRLPRDSEHYRILVDWIAAGAPFGPADLEVTAIEVTPADVLLATTNATTSLRVTAHLSDGSQQDVSPLALYTSNDDSVAAVSRHGAVTPRGRGLTSIMIRYSGQVAAARIAIPYTSPDPARPASLGEGNPGASGPADHWVDAHIGAELVRLGLPSSPICSDATFLRRVSLDLIGSLPTPEEARAFGREPGTAARRAAWVESLIARPEFVDYWTLQLADLLLLGGKGANDVATRRYFDWVRDQVARHTPLDRMVRDLLTAQGDLRTVGPANFHTLSNDPRDFSEHVSRMFLGTRIACARCHAHPNDRWTQDDYHQFAAYFARVGRSAEQVQVRQRGEVDHPKTGLPVTPKPLGAPRPVSGQVDDAATDRRVELAQWLTAADNPLFARSLVNRVWKHLFGRGLVEPVDDLRPTNPATHPALLDALARDFVEHGFDLRHLLRTLTSSRTYQRASTTTPSNRLDSRLFSHAYVRELPAPVFLDALVQATGVRHRFEGQPADIRAVQLISPQVPSPSLDVLGRCNRERPCETSGQAGGGLARTLHLINGSTLHDKFAGGVVDQLLAGSQTDEQIVTELYLRTLTRLPAAEETAEWSSLLARAPQRREAVEDLLWTLLNSREFGFNH